ncbi:MAG: hypothetical protein ACIAQ0_08025 [Phycisphaerales bacterium JB058]
MRGIRGLIVGVFLGLCSVASGQDGSLFLEQWEKAKTVQGFPDGIYLELLHETAKVQAPPGYEPADGLYSKTIKLWWGSQSAWRVSEDSPELPITSLDVAWSSQDATAWHMSPSRLVIVDPNHLPEGRDPSRLFSHLSLVWRTCVVGLPANSPLGFEPIGPVELDGQNGRWRATTRSRKGDRIAGLEGTVSPDGGHFLVERIDVRAPGSDAEPLGGMELRGWRREPLAPTGWIAESYENFGPDGVVYERYTIQSFRPLTANDRLSQLVSAPKSDGVDPLRGRVAFTAIEDFRPGAKSPAEIRGVMPDDFGPSQKAPVLRVAGWLALGALVLAFIYVRMKSQK